MSIRECVSRTGRGQLAVCLALVFLFTSAAANAQTSAFQADPFEPWYGQGTAALSTPRTDILGHLKPTFGLLYHVSDGLVEQTRVDGLLLGRHSPDRRGL